MSLAKTQRRQGDGWRAVIPSGREGSKKEDFSLCSKQGFLPEPALSMAEGVEMTRSLSFPNLAPLRLGERNIRSLRVLRGSTGSPRPEPVEGRASAVHNPV